MWGNQPLSREALTALGLKETILTLVARNGRVILMRSTAAHQYVLRVVSCAQPVFDFARAAQILDADPSQSTIVVFGDSTADAEALAESFLPAGTIAMTSPLATLDPKYGHVVDKHAHETGEYVREQIG